MKKALFRIRKGDSASGTMKAGKVEKKEKARKDKIPAKKEESEKKLEARAGGDRGKVAVTTMLSGMLRSIRLKLFIGLLIPIVLLALYGTISYRKSEEAIITNFENSSMDTINAVGDYLNFGFTTIQEKAGEMLFDSNIGEYYNRPEGAQEAMYILARSNVESTVQMVKKTNSFIAGVHMIGREAKTISTEAASQNSVYDQISETAFIKPFEEKATKNMWVGEHSELDGLISRERVIYSADKYACSFIQIMNSRKGFVIIDVSKEKIMNMFLEYNLGDQSILGFVLKDDREVISGTEEASVFSGQPYYRAAMEGEENSGLSYEIYNEKEYLFLYSKVGTMGATVCALIPKSTILQQVSGIRRLNIMFVTISALVALATAVLVAGGVSIAISFLSKKIKQAATGDLTTSFHTKRKDEFLDLASGIGNMLQDMRKLIGEVQEVGSKVSGSAGGVSDTSEKLLVATKDISRTIDDIEQGIVQQASDTEQCLLQMSGLSDQINQVYNSASEIGQIAGNTKSIAGEGIIIIDELNQKAKATTDITHDVIDKIQEFEVQSQSIGSFVTIINDIAEQTNLLSLNASIEAARAGDAGRGFAVVADEIRKLADQSLQAAKEIQNIVTQIRHKTKDTVDTAKQAENIVESQSESLSKTVRVFDNINSHVNDLANNLDTISEGIKKIEAAKLDTMEAIQSISAVSEETAAASQEVSATAVGQIDSVERLRLSAQELAYDARRLEEAIQLFKIK